LSINIARINQRVANKGHNVSDEKIKSRFQKSIQNAIKVKAYTKRFFVIDNSQENNPILLLETENNKKINFINKTFFPQWAEPFKI
jgi:predicted ABC-type ATPase